METSRTPAAAVAVVLLTLAWTALAQAHHSFAADYDVRKPVTLTGTVVRAEWTNPHVHFYMTVADAAGTKTEWELEMGAVNGLFRRGWTRNMLVAGDVVTVEGYLARERAHQANARVITLRDGRKMSGGTVPEAQAN